MDCVHFLLVRSSAKCSVSHTNEHLATIPCDHWPMVIELLEPNNSGRLLTVTWVTVTLLGRLNISFIANSMRFMRPSIPLSGGWSNRS